MGCTAQQQTFNKVDGNKTANNILPRKLNKQERPSLTNCMIRA